LILGAGVVVFRSFDGGIGDHPAFQREADDAVGDGVMAADATVGEGEPVTELPAGLCEKANTPAPMAATITARPMIPINFLFDDGSGCIAGNLI
jgi:hypothetical protein